LIVSVHRTQIHQSETEDVMRKMPAFTKAPPETLERFTAATSGFDGLEPRRMFSYPSVFLNGNMLACVFQDRIMVRLSDADRTIFLTIPNTRLFEPSPGRAMREYVEAPTPDEMPVAELRGWIQRGIDYVASLPKKAKPAKKAVGRRKAVKRATAAKSVTTKRRAARPRKKSAAKRAKKRR
jgi:TfoX/Sxy family transcriptional regulator of competence genes